MKKIIILSRSTFPTNTPRSNRATELAKEFGRNGHEVHHYAVLGNYNYDEYERKFNVHVHDMGKLRFSKTTSDATEKNGILFRILSKLFGTLLMYPDIEFMFKVRRLVRKLPSSDMLITIAQPYPIHWGTAWALSSIRTKKFGIWVADCGDPFMGNNFTSYPFYFKYLERLFCKKADYISVPTKASIAGYYPEFHEKIKVIPQGFSFEESVEEVVVNNPVPVFIYSGTFYKGQRDPTAFLEYLCRLDSVPFKLIIYTRSGSLLNNFSKSLGEKLIIKDYIEREKLLNEMRNADFLLNINNSTKVHSPSKLIDYALSGRPILSIDSTELDIRLIDEFLAGDYSGSLKIGNIEKYNIQNVAQQFLNLSISENIIN